MISKLINLSDIHFGNLKVNSKLIEQRLNKYFLPYINEPIFLSIAGDIFDRSLSLNDISSHYVLSFFIKLFDKLEKTHSILRLLRGTYSHELQQMQILFKLYKSRNYTFNFKYIDKIEYERIEELDNLKVLYIPDDLPFNSSIECISYIKEHLSSFNVNKVDYIFAHVNFKHIFPSNLFSYPKITFEIDQFKDIINKYIISGHIHVPSRKQNMIYIGSFDRLRFGEKGKKGFFIIEDFLSKNNNSKIKFIENKDATIFKDYYLSIKLKNILEDKQQDSSDILINNLKEFINKNYRLENIEYLRCIDIKNEYKYSIRKYIKETYPLLKVSFIKSKKMKNIDTNFLLSEEENNILLESLNNENMIIPNKFNLASIIKDKLDNNDYKLSISEITKYLVVN